MSRPNYSPQQSSRQAYQRQQGIYQTLQNRHRRQQSTSFGKPLPKPNERQSQGIVGFFKRLFG